MKKVTKKLWVVERGFKLENGYVVPVRGVLWAETEDKAKAGANRACRRAFNYMGGVGRAQGPSMVMYFVDEK